jgi:MscS family membrane protein
MDYDFLNRTYFGNTVSDYLIMAGVLLAGLLFKKIISRFLSSLLFRLFKRYSWGVSFEQFSNLLSRPFSLLILLLLGYFAFNNITFPEEWKIGPGDKFGVRMIIYKLFLVALIFAIAWAFVRMVDFMGLILVKRASGTTSRLDDQLVPFFRDSLKIILVIMFLFVMLGTVFELNVVTLIGGLGIGGLAVALAAKETLENLLGSFTIFMDKPFVVGDMVKTGSVSGNVERIGLRSTRLRTLEKSLITVPNKKMVDAELENLTDRLSFRSYFRIPIRFNTAPADLKNILKEIKATLDQHHLVLEGNVVKFDQFSESSLDILIQYYVNTVVWDEFMLVKEEINFRIFDIVTQNNSGFAFPSTSLYVEKGFPFPENR